MLVGRESIQRSEERELAPYALRSTQAGQRRIVEPDDPYRTPFQRDRDRIIHSAAYRRLGNKTQVFISFEGEHYRTRLTHTEEATQLAVTVARALGANSDLTEAISRAHDLGHAPFGHAGEEALAAKMSDHGGFEHNRQTLRLIDELEVEYPHFRGLNLTLAVREGVMAHRGRIVDPVSGRRRQPSIEAQIADIADEIAYGCHDLQDGLASGLLTREGLVQAAPPWWAAAIAALTARWGPLPADLERRRVKGYLTNYFVSDLIETSAETLATLAVATPEAVTTLPDRVIALSPPLRAWRESLHHYLYTHLYHHHEVITMTEKAKRLLGELFDAYASNPAQLPDSVQQRIGSTVSLADAICDHIASMTDRGAVREHHRLFDIDAQILP